MLTDKIEFPDPASAREDGLLAIGGDLRPRRLLLAYSMGIFPWFSDDRFLMWFSPAERFVIFPGKVKISKSMKLVLRSGKFSVSVNRAFKEVIENCADRRKGQNGTWITSGMIEAYCRLHKLGYAHSLEVWETDKLAGGLYGVQVGKVFCGESMFSKRSNASKAALIHLAREMNFALIDCQVYTPHLESLGAEFISRKEYIRWLTKKDDKR